MTKTYQGATISPKTNDELESDAYISDDDIQSALSWWRDNAESLYVNLIDAESE